MLQIKTIYKASAAEFDKEVNEALADGWSISRRTFDPHGFLAELERDVITEAEKGCENCRHCEVHPHTDPCYSCSDDCDKWEPMT